MLRVNRIELLKALQTVSPGLSPKDIIEQSSCFAFKDGEVFTFNDEIACRMNTPLSAEIEGAVQAKPLIAILDKLTEVELNISIGKGELLVVGKRREAAIRMEAEVTLPIDAAERPGKVWTPLHKDFVEAISIVQESAGRDRKLFALTCVHVHPKWVEAFDNSQVTRYKLKTGIKEKCLISKKSLQQIIYLEMKEFNETETWIHFRNSTGLVISCRRFLEEYPDLNDILNFDGEPTKLPDGLEEAAEKAEIFSQENADSNQIRIDLKAGKMRIQGIGNSGRYKEYKKVKYSGPDISFQIPPKLLIELLKRNSECEVSADKLKVSGEKWTFVASLNVIEEDTTKKKTPKEEDEE